ncbi:MAG: hypothetical protein AAGI66_09430 [Cyanobacteria bacterium P01_H01_bin.74]
MTDRISSTQSGTVNADLLLNTPSVEKAETLQANKSAGTVQTENLDAVIADISAEAKTAYDKDKEVLRFGRLAQRGKGDFDAEKVAELKKMVDNGRINEYLRTVSPDAMAEAILNSSAGQFLTLV